jgi:hypothetical protein
MVVIMMMMIIIICIFFKREELYLKMYAVILSYNQLVLRRVPVIGHDIKTLRSCFRVYFFLVSSHAFT